MQDTPSSEAFVPAGLGVRRILHPVPFHRSASGAWSPVGSRNRLPFPTAMHHALDSQDTAFSALTLLITGLCKIRTVQRESADRSASGASLAVPTVVHNLDEVHETPFSCSQRLPPCALLGGALASSCTDHLEPCQRSAIGLGERGAERLVKYPTAVHVVRDEQETPVRALSRLLCDGAGDIGTCRVDQSRPFHRSASVRVIGRGALPPIRVEPTAMQTLFARQETADRELLLPRPGFAVRWIVHADLFRCTASGAFAADPTAVQESGSQHDTLRNSVCGATFSSDHWVPFHRSATEPPTAVQEVTDTHDTAVRGTGPSICWIAHLVPFHRSTRARRR